MKDSNKLSLDGLRTSATLALRLVARAAPILLGVGVSRGRPIKGANHQHSTPAARGDAPAADGDPHEGMQMPGSAGYL